MASRSDRMRILRVVGDKRTVIEIPRAEARELGIQHASEGVVTVPYLMDGLFAWSETREADVTTCPICSTTSRDIVLRRRVGCARCYETFAETIDYLLARRETVVHHGRIPERLQRFRRLFVERERLLGRLGDAVNREAFEEAAELRDQIRAIEADGAEQTVATVDDAES